MPGRAQSLAPSSSRHLAAASESGGGESRRSRGAGRSNAAAQEQLRQRQAAVGGPVQANPGPWSGLGRDVGFSPVAGGELFRDGATVGDVVQGRNGPRHLGDCWLLASLAALAHSRPGMLEQAVTDHGDGTYTVRLYAEAGATAEDIRVTGDLPQTADGRDAYAQRPDPAELWVGIIEKAFAAHCGGWDAIDGGHPTHAWRILTGCKHVYKISRRADESGFTCWGTFNPNTRF